MEIDYFATSKLFGAIQFGYVDYKFVGFCLFDKYLWTFKGGWEKL